MLSSLNLLQKRWCCVFFFSSSFLLFSIKDIILFDPLMHKLCALYNDIKGAFTTKEEKYAYCSNLQDSIHQNTWRSLVLWASIRLNLHPIASIIRLFRSFCRIIGVIFHFEVRTSANSDYVVVKMGECLILDNDCIVKFKHIYR